MNVSEIRLWGLKRFGIPLGILLLAGVLAYGGWRIYLKIEPARLARRAQASIEKGDLTAAGLTIRHAFSINPNSFAVMRAAAELAEKAKDPEAVRLRRKLTDLQPKSLPAALEFATIAFQFNQAEEVKPVLERVAKLGEGSAEYHALYGRAAAASGQANSAVEHLTAAVKLEPHKEEYQVELNAALLQRDWVEDREAARKRLEAFRDAPKLRAAATRALVRDSVVHREFATALPLASEFAADPTATFEDRLTHVGLLYRTHSDAFATTLQALQTEAQGDPRSISLLLNWMNTAGRGAEALRWLNALPPEQWTDPRVRIAGALCGLSIRAWPEIEALTNGDWRGLQYLRFAVRARMLLEQGKEEESNRLWDHAFSAATRQPGAALSLARYAADWGWADRREKLLIAAMDKSRLDEATFNSLLTELSRKEDTAMLLKATSRYAANNPGHDAATNNLVMYSLLLGYDVSSTFEQARVLYEKHPGEAEYASTYALSLHLQKRDREALKVLESLRREQFERPSVAVYFGIVHAALGEKEKALRFLEMAKAADLLPEERRLVEEAQRRAR